jgi:hypothetical protein
MPKIKKQAIGKRIVSTSTDGKDPDLYRRIQTLEDSIRNIEMHYNDKIRELEERIKTMESNNG